MAVWTHTLSDTASIQGKEKAFAISWDQYPIGNMKVGSLCLLHITRILNRHRPFSYVELKCIYLMIYSQFYGLKKQFCFTWLSIPRYAILIGFTFLILNKYHTHIASFLSNKRKCFSNLKLVLAITEIC